MAITVPQPGDDLTVAAFGSPVVNQLNGLIPTAWTGVTFTNSWVNFGGTHQSVQYRKIGDIVYLRGVMKSGTMSATAFNLPVGFRPPVNITLHTGSIIGANPWAYAYSEISSAGDFIPYIGGNVAFAVTGSFSTV